MSARVLQDRGASDARLNFAVIDERASALEISKGELARLIGVNYSTLWRYRQRGMIPSHSVVRRLERVLDLTDDRFMLPAAPAEPEAA